MSKYQPISDFLSRVSSDRRRTSFGELEDVLGFSLPMSARKHNAWWANETSGGRSHKRSWSSAGWRTEALDLSGGRVTFVRAR